MKQVSIIDYGIGNILSVKRAFENQGALVKFVSEPMSIMQAERIVLPGVGAFKNGMEELKKRDLIQSIQMYCKENRPFLGICLGMQMMMELSEEFGETSGLGIIPGKVLRIENTDVDGIYHKIPHIGWNRLQYVNNIKGTILESVSQGSFMYFVHSYTVIPEKESYRLADVFYGGRRLSAVIQKGNCYGVQFHPEKSGKIGLNLLQSFLKV